MPNWKKLITSGSNAVLNQVTASSFLSTTGSGVGFVGTSSWAQYVVNGGGTPGGPQNSIQFNSASQFSGSAKFTYDEPTNIVYLTGSIINVDTNESKSLNTFERRLFDNQSSSSVLWQNRVLADTVGNGSVDWGSRQASDSTVIKSIDWESRNLFDTAAASALNWVKRWAIDTGGNTSIDWGAYQLKAGNASLSHDWDGRALYDGNGNLALFYSDTGSNDQVRLYGTSSYALTASVLLGSVGSAAQVQTQQTASTSTFYLTFVDSANASPTAETVYTTAGGTKAIYVIPDSANPTLFTNTISASIFHSTLSTTVPNGLGFVGTASWAESASRAITSSYVTGSIFTSSNPALSSSYAVTASYINGMILKNNAVGGGTFAGNPKKATVTFSTAFPNTSYSVTITGEDSRTWTIESKAVGSFVINSNSNTALTNNVYWQAISYGEFKS